MAKKSPPINSGSMADISFLLLTFFLLTSSIDTDLGITRLLPPPIPPDAEAPDVRKRNIMQVLVNFNDDLRVGDETVNIADLRRITKEFLSNPTNDPNKSEQVDREFPEIGVVKVSKGVVSLQSDQSTSYEMYIKVQNELTAAVNELRDAFAKEHFGVKYEEIKNEEVQKSIQKAIPVPISEAEPKDKGGTK